MRVQRGSTFTLEVDSPLKFVQLGSGFTEKECPNPCRRRCTIRMSSRYLWNEGNINNDEISNVYANYDCC